MVFVPAILLVTKCDFALIMIDDASRGFSDTLVLGESYVGRVTSGRLITMEGIVWFHIIMVGSQPMAPLLRMGCQLSHARAMSKSSFLQVADAYWFQIQRIVVHRNCFLLPSGGGPQGQLSITQGLGSTMPQGWRTGGLACEIMWIYSVCLLTCVFISPWAFASGIQGPNLDLKCDLLPSE